MHDQELTEALVAVREVNAALLEMNEKLSTADKVKETLYCSLSSKMSWVY